MNIEAIAIKVAVEWQMSFAGVELDFALEVAKRAVAEERDGCKTVCERVMKENEKYNEREGVAAAYECMQRITARGKDA